jgi:hypothetical protein
MEKTAQEGRERERCGSVKGAVGRGTEDRTPLHILVTDKEAVVV